jgi:hypothetical protein
MDRERLRKGIDEALLSLQDLASFEQSTLTAETNVLGILRHRVASAARFGEAVPIKYQRLHCKTAKEVEHSEYLPEGFPLVEGNQPLSALLVVDRYSIVDLEKPVAQHGAPTARYAGDRLYLSRDKRWILAQRVGPCCETKGSSSEWVATCKALTDRALLDHFPLETVIQGLFASANKIWEQLSPRMDALRQRAEKVQQIVEMLSKLGNASSEPNVPEAKPKESTVSAHPERVMTLNRAGR